MPSLRFESNLSGRGLVSTPIPPNLNSKSTEDELVNKAMQNTKNLAKANIYKLHRFSNAETV
jgi:hypothetical protein